MSRTGLQFTTEGINLAHPAVRLVKTKYLNLIYSQVRNQNVLLVIGHSCTGNMGAESSLRNGTDSLIIYTVNNISHRTVRIQRE